MDYLGSIPLDKDIRVGSDVGVPLVTKSPDHPASITYIEIAQAIHEKCLMIKNETSSFVKRELT